MQLNPAEISDIIKQKLEGFDFGVEQKNRRYNR